MKQSDIQDYNSVRVTTKCAGENLIAGRSGKSGQKMRVSSLWCWRVCVNTRAGLAQARNVSAQAVRVDRQLQLQQENKEEEELNNWLDLKSSLHEVYKIDVDSR